MVGKAVHIDANIDYWGGNPRLYQLSPPLDGAEHVVICDRTPLAAIQRIDLPGLPDHVNQNVTNTVDSPIEVFAVDERGNYTGEILHPLRQLISLRRYIDGVDFGDVLARLSYEEA